MYYRVEGENGKGAFRRGVWGHFNLNEKRDMLFMPVPPVFVNISAGCKFWFTAKGWNEFGPTFKRALDTGVVHLVKSKSPMGIERYRDWSQVAYLEG